MKLKPGLQEWHPILSCTWSPLLFFPAMLVNTTFQHRGFKLTKIPCTLFREKCQSSEKKLVFFLYQNENQTSQNILWERKRPNPYPLKWYEINRQDRYICNAERSKSKSEPPVFLDQVRVLNRTLMLLVVFYLTGTSLGGQGMVLTGWYNNHKGKCSSLKKLLPNPTHSWRNS